MSLVVRERLTSARSARLPFISIIVPVRNEAAHIRDRAMIRRVNVHDVEALSKPGGEDRLGDDGHSVVRLRYRADDEHTVHLSVVHKRDMPSGPAHRWLIERLSVLCAREVKT